MRTIEIQEASIKDCTALHILLGILALNSSDSLKQSDMSDNQHFGDGNAGEAANDFGQNMATTFSKENSRHVTPQFDSRYLQLRFLNHIPNLIYTGLPIKGQEGTSLKVALIDAPTGRVIKCGVEASAMVEILVIDKTFNMNDSEDWTFDDFKAKIVTGRHGKTPLLAGHTCFNLIEGVGFVGKIFFRHTKHPLRKVELRLGARIMACPVGTRIREAATEPFTLKDRRGMNKKHYPLKLNDPVWRLENIGKNGPSRRKLQMANIMTVQHFLAEYSADPQRLQNILGKSMSPEKLVATANHAKTCNREMKDLVHFSPMFQQNSHAEMGSFLEAEHTSTQMFSDTQNEDLIIIESANSLINVDMLADASDMENSFSGDCDVGDVIVDYDPFQMNFSLSSYYLNSFMQVSNSEGSNSSMFVGFNQPSDIQDLGNIDTFYADKHLYHLNTSGFEASAKGEIPLLNKAFEKNGTDSWTPEELEAYGLPDEHLNFLDPDYPHQSSTLESTNELQSAVNSFLVDYVAPDAQTRWKMLFSVLRWFSIRRLAARKY